MDNGYIETQIVLFWRVLPLCGIIFLLWTLRQKQKKIFALFLKYIMEEPVMSATEGRKRKLFADLADTKDSLEILEIGAGTGMNFSFYSHKCKVTCLEPNGAFNPYIVEKRRQDWLSC